MKMMGASCRCRSDRGGSWWSNARGTVSRVDDEKGREEEEEEEAGSIMRRKRTPLAVAAALTDVGAAAFRGSRVAIISVRFYSATYMKPLRREGREGFFFSGTLGLYKFIAVIN